MQKHMHYDEQDLPALNALAVHIGNALGNIALREDVGIFTARELDFVKAQTYSRKFPEMKGLQLVPTASDAPEWAETVTYKMYDEVGMAKIIAAYADDLPRADISAKEVTIKLRQVGVSYGYNIRELAQSLATGANLPLKKATAARRAVEIKLNEIAMVGDANFGLFGLTNHPNIGTTVLPSGKDWNTGNPTAQELIADVQTMYDAIRVQSHGIHTPNKCILPTSHLNVLKRTLVPDTNGKTVLAWLKEEFAALEFVETPELKATTGKSKMFMGEFDVNNINLELPQPFTQLPAQERNLEVVINCVASCGGVVVTYPLAFTAALA